MEIERHKRRDRNQFQPIISRVVVHKDTVYLQGVVSDPVGDITSQTKQVLERMDELLALAGTNKSKLLSAQVYLVSMRHFRQHNLAWNDWVDPENPPARMCIQSELFDPGLLVEIMAVAAR